MAREVDKQKTRKALRRLKRVVERVETEGEKLTDWEKGFVAGVTERLETYGSAFRDPTKGALEEALSARQTQITRALEKKARGKADGKAGVKGKAASDDRPKPRSTFKSKAPVRPSRGRDIRDDVDDAPPAETPVPVKPPVKGRPKLRLVEGGKAAKPTNEDGS